MSKYELDRQRKIMNDPEIQKAIRILWVRGVSLDDIEKHYRKFNKVYIKHKPPEELPF